MYVKTNWVDVPDPELATTQPKLNAQNLNHIEQGIFNSAEKNDLEVANRKIKALFDLTEGQAWDFDRDDNNLYRVPVPSGAKLATVQKLGGKSLVFNQLVQNGNFVDTSKWSTSSNFSVENNKGTFIAIEQSSGYRMLSNVLDNPLITGHKYFVSGKIKVVSITNANCYISLVLNNGATQTTNSKYNIVAGTTYDMSSIQTLTVDGSAKNLIAYLPHANATAGDTFEISNVMLIDLTQMFGAGNEPTTVEEVKALLPNDYYEYNTGEVIHADVDKVVVKDADDVATEYPIPQAIRNLDGYGWSAGNVYNEVDFERKKFIKRVGRNSLNVSWTYSSSYSYFYHDFSMSANLIALLSGYTRETNWAKFLESDKVYFCATNGRISIRDTQYGTDTTAFRNHFSNDDYVYYELATPVETDITDILEPFNVEDGGTITFHNSNGDGYGIPVPSTEEYLVKLEEVG